MSLYTIAYDSCPRSWTKFTIPKKSGGVRHICAPCEELKRVQRQIKTELERMGFETPVLAPTSFACGFVRGRNVMTGILKHDIESPLFLEMDVKDFFDNMPVAYVKGRLIAAGIPAYLVDKIIDVCSLDGKFPQGSPVSPLLMNIGMQECDKMISAYAKKYGFTYSRYADDITLGLDPNWPEPIKNNYTFIFHGVAKILSEMLGLRLNFKKNRHIWARSKCTSPRITGVVRSQDFKGYNAPMKFRNITRAMLHNLWSRVVSGDTGREVRQMWAVVKGRACWQDTSRAYSPDSERATPDPRLNEKEWNEVQDALK